MRFTSIITAIIVMLAILLLGHVAVYYFLISVFPALGINPLPLAIAMGVLWLSFITAMLIAQKFNTIATRTFYKLAAAWLGSLLYILLAAVVYTLVVILLPLFFIVPPSTISLIGYLFLGAAIIVSIYGLINSNRIRTTSITVPMPNLPEIWKSRKVVFLSDLHLGQIRGARFAERIVARIQALKPDIVFIGGDLYDGVAVDVHGIIKPLAELKPPLGTYFIMGNHEEFSDNVQYLSAIRKIGITVLMDEKVMIDGIQLIGVDYKHAVKKEKFDEILENLHIDRNVPSILLKHVPSDLDVAEKHGISFQLSGHTHQAQVFPFTLIVRAIFKGFDYGLHALGAMQVYTSSGVGTWGPPLRVGTKSEIIEIILVSGTVSR